MKKKPLQNAKIIFFQNSPAVRFQHQRFRKSETKKKLMALEFLVDLFFLTWVHLKGSVLGVQEEKVSDLLHTFVRSWSKTSGNHGADWGRLQEPVNHPPELHLLGIFFGEKLSPKCPPHCCRTLYLSIFQDNELGLLLRERWIFPEAEFLLARWSHPGLPLILWKSSFAANNQTSQSWESKNHWGC